MALKRLGFTLEGTALGAVPPLSLTESCKENVRPLGAHTSIQIANKIHLHNYFEIPKLFLSETH
jgi:hypothetical protein